MYNCRTVSEQRRMEQADQTVSNNLRHVRSNGGQPLMVLTVETNASSRYKGELNQDGIFSAKFK